MKITWLPFAFCLVANSCATGDAAQTLANPDVTDTSSSQSGSWNGLRQACLDFTNAKRASLALDPLTQWATADSCSDKQALNDQTANAAHSHFGSCDERSQNTCPGWPAGSDFASQKGSLESCLQMMWDEGPGEPYSAHGHYINMSNASYTKLTCGFSLQNGSLWVNMDFR